MWEGIYLSIAFIKLKGESVIFEMFEESVINILWNFKGGCCNLSYISLHKSITHCRHPNFATKKHDSFINNRTKTDLDPNTKQLSKFGPLDCNLHFM